MMMENQNTSSAPDVPIDEKTHELAVHPEGRKKRANMHEGIGVWCDCCSCEAEPYWAELADEMGVDLSDYEDEAKPPRQGK